MVKDLTSMKKIVMDIATKSGEIAMSYFRSVDLEKRSKSEVYLDVVTAGDLAVDEYIRKHLTRHFPDIEILTEETAPKEYGNLVERDLLFVVDPIDGTMNFSRGDRTFCVSIGLVTKGIPILGVLFAPAVADMYAATIEDTYASCNGVHLSHSPTTDLSSAVVYVDGFSNPTGFRKTHELIGKLADHALQVRALGSAALEIAYVGSGIADVYMHPNLKPWDMAAATCIAQKAGAVVSAYDGGEWNVFSKQVLTATPALHGEIVRRLR